jgi:D-alanyl-D-alanine carboxypeptidase
MRTYTVRCVICSLTLLGTSLSAVSSAEESLEVRLQTVLDKSIEKHDTRGASSAIVFPDARLWTGVSGISHGTVPMDPDMLFGIGSVTKNVVAALTLDLVEEGRLSLDDPVSEFLPPFPHVEDSITIRQLLNHTSGLYMFWDNDGLWDALKADRARVWTPEEVLTYIGDPYFEPGKGWRYSNTNYLLLGMILEKVTDSSLSTEFRDRFWNPLGIEGYLSIQEKIPDRLAHVFGDNFHYGAAERDLTLEPRASHESIIFGSGGLFMTAADLARWSQALFGGEVLGEWSMEEMYRFVSFRPIANMRAYGLGVQKFERRFASGEEAIGHGGGNIGSVTYMVYLPEHMVSVVVMVNAFPTSCADDIAKGLVREVLREAGALGWFPYVPFFPGGFFVCCLLIALAIEIFYRSRRARSA